MQGDSFAVLNSDIIWLKLVSTELNYDTSVLVSFIITLLSTARLRDFAGRTCSAKDFPSLDWLFVETIWVDFSSCMVKELKIDNKCGHQPSSYRYIQ